MHDEVTVIALKVMSYDCDSDGRIFVVLVVELVIVAIVTLQDVEPSNERGNATWTVPSLKFSVLGSCY
mgnify:CR=1 FL=1